jgi:hypothetical protein
MEAMLRSLSAEVDQTLGAAETTLTADTGMFQQLKDASAKWNAAAAENLKKYEHAMGLIYSRRRVAYAAI